MSEFGEASVGIQEEAHPQKAGMHILRKPGVLIPREESFIPNILAGSVVDIDFSYLKDQGTRFVVFDVDNTLLKVGDKAIIPEIVEYLNKQKAAGVFEGVYLASRSGRDLSHIADGIDAQTIKPESFFKKKPHPDYFKHIQRTIGCRPSEIAIIGDRISHDVIGANRAGMTTVLVEPIGGFVPTDYLLTAPREKRLQVRLANYLSERKLSRPTFKIKK